MYLDYGEPNTNQGENKMSSKPKFTSAAQANEALARARDVIAAAESQMEELTRKQVAEMRRALRDVTPQCNTITFFDRLSVGEPRRILVLESFGGEAVRLYSVHTGPGKSRFLYLSISYLEQLIP